MLLATLRPSLLLAFLYTVGLGNVCVFAWMRRIFNSNEKKSENDRIFSP